MEIASAPIPLDGMRSLKAYSFEGSILSPGHSVYAAFSLSRSGLRGILSKHSLATVKCDALKAALKLPGKVHFLDVASLAALCRLRLEDPTEAIRVLHSGPLSSVCNDVPDFVMLHDDDETPIVELEAVVNREVEQQLGNDNNDGAAVLLPGNDNGEGSVDSAWHKLAVQKTQRSWRVFQLEGSLWVARLSLLLQSRNC